MRKLTMSLMTAFALLLVVPTQLKAEASTVPAATTVTVKSTDMNVLIARVETIKAMDRSEMSSSEKKELRTELRAIKSDLKKKSKSDANSAAINNGGVYLSVGAIIIIILLLILLL